MIDMILAGGGETELGLFVNPLRQIQLSTQISIAQNST
jgi:hypothetical protein